MKKKSEDGPLCNLELLNFETDLDHYLDKNIVRISHLLIITCLGRGLCCQSALVKSNDWKLILI